MKEYTVVTTVQITEIVQREDIELYPKDVLEYRLKQKFNIDDVKVINRQMFIRDLPNDPEVVVDFTLNRKTHLEPYL